MKIAFLFIIAYSCSGLHPAECPFLASKAIFHTIRHTDFGAQVGQTLRQSDNELMHQVIAEQRFQNETVVNDAVNNKFFPAFQDQYQKYYALQALRHGQGGITDQQIGGLAIQRVAVGAIAQGADDDQAQGASPRAAAPEGREREFYS